MKATIFYILLALAWSEFNWVALSVALLIDILF